jgi:hypothetical protein
LLWILRPLLDAAIPSHRFPAVYALGERGQLLVVFFGKVAEEHGDSLSQARERLP